MVLIEGAHDLEAIHPITVENDLFVISITITDTRNITRSTDATEAHPIVTYRRGTTGRV